MFVAFCVQGVNVIVPATVRHGRLCTEIDRGAILRAIGVPPSACVRWGLEAAPDDSYSSAWRALYEPTSIRPWERPGVPDGAKQRALNAHIVDRERRAAVMRRAMGWT